MTPKYMRNLRRKMDESFNEDELSGLTFDLAVDWEHLAGKTKPEKIRSLISHQARRGNLDDLVELLREERPDETWDDPPPKKQQIEDEKAGITESERREIFEKLMNKVRPIVSDVYQLKSLVEADLGYFNPIQVGNLIRLLSSAKLIRHVKLESASLINEDLSDADLSGAFLRKADLEKAWLRGANLQSVNLFKANLKGANLEGANFKDTDLVGANLSDAKVSKAQLAEAKLDETTVMPDGELFKGWEHYSGIDF